MPLSAAHMRLFYRPFAGPTLVVLLYIAVQETIALAIPWLQGRLLKNLAQSGALTDILGLFGTIALLWFVLSELGHRQWQHNYTRVSQPLKRHIRRITLERLMGLSLAQHLDRHSGVKNSTINEGERALETLLRTMVQQIIPLVAGVSAVLAMLAFQQPLLAAILISGGALFVLRTRSMNRIIRDPLKRLKKEELREGKFRGDVMRNVELVQLSAQEERAIRESMESYQRTHDGDAAIWIPHSLRAQWRDKIIVTTQAAVLATCIWLMRTGRADIGDVFTWLTWTAVATSRITNIGWLWRDILSELAAAKVFLELLDLEPEVADLPDAVSPQKLEGRIEFHDVWLSYSRHGKEGSPEPVGTARDAPDSLRGVSLIIEPGQRVAIVGPSGAGKSTLIYALLRGQNPSRGHITVDGYDVRELAIRSLRNRIGLVPQQVFLFDKSLRYNICWQLGAEGTAAEERLEQVIDATCLRERVDSLEYGSDTLIGERGIKVSGGERQRIGIARSIIVEPDILIFDEATSNLDAINERLINESLRTASAGRTTITIAHRLSTVRDADVIFVMDRGRIVGRGTHEELLASCQTYQRLVADQLSVI